MSDELELKMEMELGVEDDICRGDSLVLVRVTNRDERVPARGAHGCGSMCRMW